MLDKGQRLVYNKGWRGGNKKDLKTPHIVVLHKCHTPPGGGELGALRAREARLGYL